MEKGRKIPYERDMNTVSLIGFGLVRPDQVEQLRRNGSGSLTQEERYKFEVEAFKAKKTPRAGMVIFTAVTSVISAVMLYFAILMFGDGESREFGFVIIFIAFFIGAFPVLLNLQQKRHNEQNELIKSGRYEIFRFIVSEKLWSYVSVDDPSRYYIVCGVFVFEVAKNDYDKIFSGSELIIAIFEIDGKYSSRIV